MRIHYFKNEQAGYKNAMVIWSPTQNGSSFTYSHRFEKESRIMIIKPDQTELGKVNHTTGSKVDITVSELPQIILY